MYKNALKKFLLIVLVFCSTILPTLAQGKNFFISRPHPSWIRKIDFSADTLQLKNTGEGYYISLLENQNHVELQENYTHVIRQIVSDAGVQNKSQISVTYDPAYEKLIFHKITIWRNHQPHDRLNASKFKVLQNEKDLSRFIYSGTYDAYIILDDVRKGDRIEYAYTLKGHNPIFGNKYANDFYFEQNKDIKHQYTNLIVKNNRTLRFKNFNFNTEPKIQEKDGFKSYEWESRSKKKHEYADYEPSWYNSSKHTQVSEYQSWNEVANWGLKVNSYAGIKTPLVDQKFKELFQQAKQDPARYIVLATRFVQDEIRYMGIELGEYSQRPNSPEKVLQQRYGDCKDKSLLLVYLLNKASIPAYMAYADTYSGKKMNEVLPSPIVFNHAVVMVEYDHIKTWIDPTISYQRGNFKNIFFPDYGQALVLKPETLRPEDVISIPTGKLVANLTFKVADTVGKEKTTLVIKSTYTDNYADDIRSQIADNGKEGTEKNFLEYIIKYYPDAETKSQIQFKDNEETNTLEITESYTLGNFWLKEETNLRRNYVYFYGDLIREYLRDIKAKGRKDPMSLKYPANVEQNIFITFPFVPNVKKEVFQVETDNYFFELASIIHGREVKLSYVYRNISDHIELKDIPKYVKDSQKIGDMLSYAVIYHPSGEFLDFNQPNPYTWLLSMMTVLISGFFLFGIYQRKTPYDLEEMLYAKSISGWMIVVAIVLVLSLIGIFSNAYRTGFYDQTTWEALAKLKTGEKFLRGIFYCIVITGYSLKFSWTVLILMLLFNRRKELPSQFIIYSVFSASFSIFQLSMYFFLSQDKTVYLSTTYLVQVILIAFITFLWVRWLKRSENIRQTFVFSYPENSWKKELFQLRKERLTTQFSKANGFYIRKEF